MKSTTKIYLIFLFSCLFVFHGCDICDSTFCFSDGFACYDQDPTNDKFCDEKCRPKYGTTERCFLCNADTEFYSISTSTSMVDSSLSYTCGTCNGDIILPSKECIGTSDSHDGLKKFGVIYYKECPSYSRVSEPSIECICENMYFEEILYNEKKKKNLFIFNFGLSRY